MSRGPGIREIFSNKPQRKNDSFQPDKEESKQQLKISKDKDSGVQTPQMKKYGAYKPKILAGKEDFLEIQANPCLDTGTLQPKSSDQLSPITPPKSVSSKPWVIGDKNIPMVLSTLSDNDIEEDNGSTEPSVEDSTNRNSGTINGEYNNLDKRELRKLSISSETTLILQNFDDQKQVFDNPAVYTNSTISVDSVGYTFDGSNDIDTHRILPGNDEQNELPGVYIPPPDYDEDEKTLDFNSEDTDDPNDGGDDRKPRQVKPKSPIKVYEGADLSHFLAEDEPEKEVVVLRKETKSRSGTVGRNVKSEVLNAKSSQKSTIYKQQSPNKSSKKSKGNVPTFNSVRSFSYADSKFGTKGKSLSKSLSSPSLPDDDEIFLNSHNQQSSYESFLKSRHAEDLPSDNSGVEAINVESGHSSKFKDDPVWKKLTLRLKRRISKSAGGKE